jgi:hypothetical protein
MVADYFTIPGQPLSELLEKCGRIYVNVVDRSAGVFSSRYYKELAYPAYEVSAYVPFG